MKKIIFVLLFVISTIQFSQAQIDFGIKAGINYNADSFNKESVLEVYDDINVSINEEQANTKTKTGFHAGFWTRVQLPIVGYYIRPEIVFTSLKSEFTASGETLADYSFQKIDIPVLFGKKFLKVVHLFAGPSFQYVIDGDFDFKVSEGVDLEALETKVDGLTVGVQLGGGIELGKFGVDVRWERGFSDIESNLINNFDESENYEFDTRINQIIISLSYRF